MTDVDQAVRDAARDIWCRAETRDPTVCGPLAKLSPAQSEAVLRRLYELAHGDGTGTVPWAFQPATPVAMPATPVAMPGVAGDICPSCGQISMRRNGTCLVCMSCGETTGCS